MKREDIRIVNHNQEQGLVFFHTTDNRTITRTVATREIVEGNIIRNKQGEEARINYWIELFNAKYSEPQRIEYPKESPQMQKLQEREALLLQERSLGVLTPDQKEELREVQKKIDLLMQGF